MWDRKEHTWTSAEFSAAMKTLGLDVSPGAMAVHVVFGNDCVKLKWSNPQCEPESEETESPESTYGTSANEEGAEDGAD